MGHDHSGGRSGFNPERFGPRRQDSPLRVLGHSRVVPSPCLHSRGKRGQGSPHRIATGVLAGRAQHRAGTHPRSSGTGPRHLPLEPSGQRLSYGQVQAPGKRRQGRRPSRKNQRVAESHPAQVQSEELGNSGRLAPDLKPDWPPRGAGGVELGGHAAGCHLHHSGREQTESVGR